jgi:hypothetical protein
VPATTQPYPNRQLNSGRGYKPNHCSKMIQKDGHEAMYDGYNVKTHKINFAITGMHVQKIGLIMAPNTILTYTMKSIALHMLVYEISHWFFLNECAHFYIILQTFFLFEN